MVSLVRTAVACAAATLAFALPGVSALAAPAMPTSDAVRRVPAEAGADRERLDVARRQARQTGQRQTRSDAAANVNPMGRINGRIDSRIRNRVATRVGRAGAAEGSTTQAYEAAGARSRRVAPPRSK